MTFNLQKFFLPSYLQSLSAKLFYCQSFYCKIQSVCNAYYTCLSNTFTDLSTVRNIRNTSRICVTYFNITWDVPSITCGHVSYDVLISQPQIEGDTVEILTVIGLVDRFFEVTGLNNSLLDVMITVTAIDRVGQRNERIFLEQLPESLSKFCIYTRYKQKFRI